MSGALPPTTTVDEMTTAHRPRAATSWRPISTGDDTVAVADRAALGTIARLAVWPPENLSAAVGAVDSVLSALDRQASRFREDSEISWIHHSEGGRFMLSNGFAEAISVALEAARWTGGLTDPTVGDALISLGYDRDFAAIDLERREPAGGAPPAPRSRAATPAFCWPTTGTSPRSISGGVSRLARPPRHPGGGRSAWRARCSACGPVSGSIWAQPPRAWDPIARSGRPSRPTVRPAACWSASGATSPLPGSHHLVAGRSW